MRDNFENRTLKSISKQFILIWGGVICLSQNNLLSQECINVPTKSYPYYNIQNLVSNNSSKYIKVYWHIIRNSANTVGYNLSDIQECQAILNQAFNSHNIYFVYDCNIHVINNDNYLNQLNMPYCQISQEQPHVDGLDIYLLPPIVNLYPGLAGIAGNIPGKWVVMGGANTLNSSFAKNSIFPHEVGHCFGLLHAFTGQKNNPNANELGNCFETEKYFDCYGELNEFSVTAEFKDGSNSLDAEDFIGDTPADNSLIGANVVPNCGFVYPCLKSFCSGSCSLKIGCSFNPNETQKKIMDPNCTAFEPDLTNYMTYSKYSNCRNKFSNDQGSVMHNFLSGNGLLQSIQTTSESYTSSINCPCIGGADVIITNSTLYSTEVNISGNLIIEAGGDLVVTNKIKFTDSGTLIVKRGGKLKLSGSNAMLTRACNYDWWNGVRVEGNNTISQPDNYLSPTTANDAGIVFVENNATIEYARVGISTQRYNETWNEAYYGGLVQLRDCFFKHNRKGVEILRYRLGLNGTNKSYIDNVSMNGTSANSATTEGVTIWSSDGIRYERNNHSNFDKSGLTIVDGWIKVNKSHVFSNNQSGVACYATAPANSEIEIGDKSKAGMDNYFYNNQKGIECYGANGLISGRVNIYQNEINGGQTGIGLQGENLHFVGFNSVFNQPYGLYVINTGLLQKSLEHCNTFQNNLFGIIFSGRNDETQFKFNDFGDNIGNEVLLFGFSTAPTTIRNTQGEEGDPAENCFPFNDNQVDQIYTVGNTSQFNYFVPTIATTSCTLGGPIPLCNLSDACSIPNNYTKTATFNQTTKNQDCNSLKNSDPPVFTLNNYNQFDSLYQVYQLLCTTLPANCVLAAQYNSLRTQAMRDVVRTYMSVNNWTAAENFLIGANFEEAKRTLYGLYFRNQNWTNASFVLNTLPVVSAEQRQFKLSQSIALEYAQAPGTFVLTFVKDSILHVIANGEYSSAANAKSLLYLIKGETFGFSVPVLPRSNGSVVNEKSATSQLLVYPNPTSQLLSVETSNGIDIVELQLVNMQGSVIMTATPNVQKYQLETSTIPQGVYLLKVSLSNQSFDTIKVQIIH